MIFLLEFNSERHLTFETPKLFDLWGSSLRQTLNEQEI